MPKVALLIIDPQNDFHDGGSLAVPGSVEDASRIADFIDRKGDAISNIYVTMDSHHVLHIAHRRFWKKGNTSEIMHPDPFTPISNESIKKGDWEPVDTSLRDYALQYTDKLEASGKFGLLIWPEHCLIGSPGHNVFDRIQTAIHHWEHKTGRIPEYIHKGTNCLTEMYSIFKAEVPVEDDPSTSMNVDLVKKLTEHDDIVVMGQALSHCVNYSVRDLVEYLLSNGKDGGIEQVKRISLLQDCASSVPGFDEAGQEFLKYCKEEGVNVIDSVDM